MPQEIEEPVISLKKMVDSATSDEVEVNTTVEVNTDEAQDEETDPTPKKEPSLPKSNWSLILSLIVALLAVVGYFAGPKLTIKVLNYYTRSKYLPNDAMRYFIENPMSDLKFNIPIYLKVDDYNFPDLTEATMLQVDERKDTQYKMIPQWEFIFERGSLDDRVDPPTNDSFFYRDAFYANIEVTEKIAIFVDPVRGYGTLLTTSESVNSNDLPFFFTQMLIDHCFSDEFEKLSLDSFIKLTFLSEERTSLMFRSDYDADKPTRLENIKRRPSLSNSTINIAFVMMGDYEWDIAGAYSEYFEDYLHLIEDFIDVKAEFLTYLCDEEESQKELKDLGENVPIELSDLKHFSNFYEACHTYVINEGLENNTIRFLFYPYGNSEKIYDKVINDNPLYVASTNYEVSLGDWGLIYFAHDGFKTLPEDERITNFEATSIKDALDSYFAQLLNILGVPGKNMAPKFRIQIYKRIQITRNFVNFSHLLFTINNRMHHDDEVISSHVVNEVLTAFHSRSQAIESCKNYDLDSCLLFSQQMIEHLFNTDFL